MPDRDLQSHLASPLIVAELKIGIDTGRSLCRIASLNPDKYYVGIEIKPEQSLKAAERCRTHKLTNTVIINMDAHKFIGDWVDDNTFQRVHIYFPTPYPRSLREYGVSKQLICSSFAVEVYRILKHGGELRLVTDSKSYFDLICQSFDITKWWAVEWQKLNYGQAEKYLVGTPCEIDFRENFESKIFSLQLLCIKY